eukprot:TRINITY_DN1913_c0_g2_i4.p1 TRINITY_DN1913_c0_g2~~TRINITY_DN1913_c0_g2_i4.p1  ORF type:complete len:343 (+),score=8.07 TRINITY_DN1913_c0_g2_i4:299-1327(+)
MALVGVYASTVSLDYYPNFEVETLHFNLWIIPQKFRHVIFRRHTGRSLVSLFIPRFFRNYIDIGLRIKVVPGGELSHIEMHLPAVNEKEDLSFHDLSEVVLNDRINDLLFGRKVNVDVDNGVIEYSRDGVKIIDKVIGVSNIVNLKNNGRYRIDFEKPLQASFDKEFYYVRFRYECRNSDEILNEKGWGFAKLGFVVDLRLNDIRETVEFNEINQSHNMKDVKEFNAFIIHPTNFMRSAQSPSVHYSRILEPNAWRPYLESCKPYSDARKYVINQWKTQGVVTSSSPYRMFAQLQNEFGLHVFIMYFLGGVFVSLLPKLFSVLSWLAGLSESVWRYICQLFS